MTSSFAVWRVSRSSETSLIAGSIDMFAVDRSSRVMLQRLDA